MNQREALVTILDHVADLGEPLDKQLQRAIKVLAKRAEVLRLRYERRAVGMPEDLADEPLIASPEQIFADLHTTQCACGKKKETHSSFCPGCYEKVSPGTRKALWIRNSGRILYPHAACRALPELGLTLRLPE